MLRELSIHGFKSVRQDTKIEFGRVNLFIGGNGVGKSNVLEAIGLLSACLAREITADELNKKGVRLSVPTLFKAAFKNHKLRSNFDLKATWDGGIKYATSVSAGPQSEELSFHSELLSVNGEKVLGRSPHGFSLPSMTNLINVKEGDIRSTRGMWDVFRHLLPEHHKHTLANELEAFGHYAIYSPQTAFLRGTELENTSVKPIGLNGGGLAKAFSTISSYWEKLRRTDTQAWNAFNEVLSLVWVPGWTSQIRIEPINPSLVSSQVKTADAALYFIDKHMKASRNKLSAYDSSEGTLYLLFIVVLLLHPEAPKIFAVDNIDSALNPKITRNLLETIIKLCCADAKTGARLGPEQVFLTSHNPTSLDAFDIFDDQQRIFVVMRDKEDGSSKITRLKPPPNTTKSDWIKASQGRNLSELWIEGRIKGALGL